MKTGNWLGIASLVFLAIAETCPILFSFAAPVYVVFGLSLGCSVGAGWMGPRKWFFLTGALALVLIVFLVFVFMILQGSKVGV
jgi:phosphatidylglycerophosphate synthase